MKNNSWRHASRDTWGALKMCLKGGGWYPEFDEHAVVFGDRTKACLQLLTIDAYFKHILKK
jgi:hypothetical protein